MIPVLALLMSCATTRKVETAKTLEIYGPGVIHSPVIADLDVKEEKVTGTAVGSSASLSTVKNLALVDAIKKANADVLVSPSFELETKGRSTTATVTGFPANYRNFRSATPADSLLVKAGYMHRVNTAVVDDSPARKGKGGGVAIAVVLVLAALVIGLTGGGGF
ncbi:MAG: hypothetical protein JNM91_10935 [Flavobacteriales bacterium]|nr:hypothetical protein [Flavobacteriales bacterium]